MITPYLESLIIKGEATFKTFVAGGATNKHVLNIQQDKFIVITDITYFSNMYLRPETRDDLSLLLEQAGLNTQLTILGERGFNRYVFRNQFALAQIKDEDENLININIPTGSVKMDCYLIHTDSVSFNFSRSVPFTNDLTAIAPVNVPAYPSPMDYGKEGQANSLVSIQQMEYQNPPLSWLIDNENENLAPTTAQQYIQKEFSYPVITDTAMTAFGIMAQQWGAPILHVNYVEIKGLPNNINSK